MSEFSEMFWYQGQPLKDNSRSTRCGCGAMIRLLRTTDGGWYISEHRAEHNHPLSSTCGEKLHWQSHRHIDRHAKDLVVHLRENNVSLGKVYSIIGIFLVGWKVFRSRKGL